MLAVLATAASGWAFVIYPDSECENTPSDHISGDDDLVCAENSASHRCFEIHDMGNCILWLYATEEDCTNDDFQQQYDFGEEDQSIPPNFEWDWFTVDSC